MNKPKRLRTDNDALQMFSTIDTLRKIRTAGTQGSEGLKKSLGSRILSVFHKKQDISFNNSDCFVDAVKLGKHTGNYLGAKLAKKDSLQLYNERTSCLGGLHEKYEKFKTSSYVKTDYVEVLSHITGRLRNVSIDDRYSLEREFIQNNTMGVKSLNELLKKNIAVVAPLSGDFFLASVYSAYISQKLKKTLDVYPILLDQNLQKNKIPIINTDKYSSIGIYIDTTDTGNTGQAVFDVLQQSYPNKKIHKPRNNSSQEFPQSKKIKNFWKKYNSTT